MKQNQSNEPVIQDLITADEVSEMLSSFEDAVKESAKKLYGQSEDDTHLKEYEFQKSAIEELLHDLPPIQLKALTIHEKEQYSWQDVSEKLGVKSSSLVHWKSKFIKQLRKRLSEHGR